MPDSKRICAGLLALLIASVIWLPCLHLLFRKPLTDFHGPTGVSPKAHGLAARHLELWSNPVLRREELAKMRGSNAEWDFMGRGFLAWSLANMALRDSGSKALYLDTIDTIIDETLQVENEKGMFFFLMPYARFRPYTVQPPRCLFLDGEIAMMLASRC